MSRNTILTLRRLTILTMFALTTAEVWQDKVDNSDMESHPADSTTVLQIARQDSPSAGPPSDDEPL